jgi:hypothetical protein
MKYRTVLSLYSNLALLLQRLTPAGGVNPIILRLFLRVAQRDMEGM